MANYCVAGMVEANQAERLSSSYERVRNRCYAYSGAKGLDRPYRTGSGYPQPSAPTRNEVIQNLV